MTASRRPYHHLPDGRFRNPEGSPSRRVTPWDMAKFLFHQFTAVRSPTVPEGHLIGADDAARALARATNPSVTWLGHACFLLRMGGRTILTDPFLGEVAGPYGFGPRRFVPPALRVEQLPPVDILLVSHNHYDHLDTPTLNRLAGKETMQVITPLGLGPLFTRLGFANVAEHDWWDRLDCGGVTVTTLPAVHFSSRGPFDRNRTLWCSFSIDSGTAKVWFSGDTATGAVFDEIGRRAGPFDLALVAIGAYTPPKIMQPVHANPEEAVEIVRAIGAKKAVGMHWGAIMLTPEDPFEAPGRFLNGAREQGYGEQNVWTMKVGETRGL